MNDKPTPETDLLQSETWKPNWAAHARKLERERDEARERERVAIKSWDEERQRAIRESNRVLEAIRERDEAREYADKLAEGLPDGMLPKDVEVLREANLGLATELATVTAQRDRLIKAVEPLEYWRDISECDCSCPLPQGGCLRCDLNRVLKTTNPNEP